MNEAKRPKYGNKPCSEDFQIFFLTLSSPVAECDICGRAHFDSSHRSTLDEAELSKLISQNDENPDAYVRHDAEIRWGYFMRQRVIWKCPCGFDGALEKSFWDNLVPFSEYAKSRRLKEVLALKKKCNAVDAIEKAVQGFGH